MESNQSYNAHETGRMGILHGMPLRSLAASEW